jgi:hypothetical protein
MIIAVDFDGTLHTARADEWPKIGAPAPYAAEVMRQIAQWPGFCIIPDESRQDRPSKAEGEILRIMVLVSDFYDVDMYEVYSTSRKREICEARQVAMYFVRKITSYPTRLIGEVIGNRDHATVLHAVKAVEDLIDTDKAFRIKMRELEDILKNA